jgi:hypothetical protein
MPVSSLRQRSRALLRFGAALRSPIAASLAAGTRYPVGGATSRMRSAVAAFELGRLTRSPTGSSPAPVFSGVRTVPARSIR